MQTGAAFTLPRDIAADLDTWLEPFLDATPRRDRAQDAPQDGATVCPRAAERWRAQEHPADGRAARAARARPAAPLHQQPGLGRRATVAGAGRRGRPRGRRRGCRPGGGRLRFTQEGRTLGWGGTAVLRRGGQDDELSGVGVADAGPRRGPGPGWTAVVPAGGVEQRPGALRGGGGAGSLAGGPEQAGNRLDRDRPAGRRWGALRLRPGGRRLWRQPRLPAGTGPARARLGCRGRLHPAGLSDHGPTAPVADADRTPGQAPGAEPPTRLGC